MIYPVPLTHTSLQIPRPAPITVSFPPTLTLSVHHPHTHPHCSNLPTAPPLTGCRLHIPLQSDAIICSLNQSPPNVCHFFPFLHLPPLANRPLLIRIHITLASSCLTPPPNLFTLAISRLLFQSRCKVPTWDVDCPFSSIDVVRPCWVSSNRLFL